MTLLDLCECLIRLITLIYVIRCYNAIEGYDDDDDAGGDGSDDD